VSSTRITRRVNAPRAAVYRAFLDARAVATWMVPTGMTSQVHAFEPREGGSFRISLMPAQLSDASRRMNLYTSGGSLGDLTTAPNDPACGSPQSVAICAPFGSSSASGRQRSCAVVNMVIDEVRFSSCQGMLHYQVVSADDP
jgi:hypothetical protein